MTTEAKEWVEPGCCAVGCSSTVGGVDLERGTPFVPGTVLSARSPTLLEETSPGPKSVGWFCTYTPLEVIAAAGFEPFRIFGSPGRIAGAAVYLPPNICPYVRACLEEAFSGRLDGIAGVVLVHSCNAMGQLASAWRRYTSVPVMAELHVPRSNDPKARAYMLSEMRGLIRGLERAGGTVSADSLAAAIRTFRKIRAGWRGVLERQRRVPALLSGAGVSRLGRSLLGTGPERAEEIINSWRQTENSGHNPRFILTGSIVSPGLLDLFDSVEVDIVYDETCSGGRALSDATPRDVLGLAFTAAGVTERALGDVTPRYLQEPGLPDSSLPTEEGDGGRVTRADVPSPESNLDGNGPSEVEALMKDLASWYLGRTPCARMKPADRRIRHLISLAREYSACGVISSVMKFCDPYLYEQPLLRQALFGEGIPYLLIEHEYGIAPEGRLLTRLEAFIERHGIQDVRRSN